MPASILNTTPDYVPLPAPLRGVLKPGQKIILNVSQNFLIEKVPGIDTTFRIGEERSGPFDGRYATGVIAAAMQREWHVDFDVGDDHADGSSRALAIKTLAELFRRLPEDTCFEQGVDIYLYGQNKPTDPWRTRWKAAVQRATTPTVYPTSNYALTQIRVHGMSPRTYYSGAFTAVQAMNFATNTPFMVTDTNMKGANYTPPVLPPNDQTTWYNPTIDWFGNPRGSSRSGQRMRITSGPRAGATAWTSAGNLASFNVPGGGPNGAIRTGNWGVSIPFGFTANFATVGFTATVPQAGDAYVVEDLPLLYIDWIESRGNGSYYGDGIAFNGFKCRVVNGADSQIPSNTPPLILNGAWLVFVECQFDIAFNVVNAGSQGSFYAINCTGIDGISVTGQGSFAFVDAGVYHLGLTASNSAVMAVDADALVETGIVLAQEGGQAWTNAVQVWDTPGHSIKAGLVAVDRGDVIFFGNDSFYGTNRLWGIDQTGNGPPFVSGRAYGVCVVDNGRFLYNGDVAGIQSLVTIAGRAADFSIGQSYLSGDRCSSVYQSTSQQTPLAICSFANLFKTVAQGGLGGRAIDLDTGSIIGDITSRTIPTLGGAYQPFGPQQWVDPINGNDKNGGFTQATAIKTNFELANRLDAFPINADIDIFYTSYPPVSDPLELHMEIDPTTAGHPTINFHAPAFVTKSSGTLSAVIARAAATNTPWDVQDGAVNTAGDVNLRMRITAGPRAGAQAWVAKSTGAGRRRTSEWGLFDPLIGGTPVTPQVGDAYVIEQPTGVNQNMAVSHIRITSGGAGAASLQSPLVNFYNFDFDSIIAGGTFPVSNDGATVTFINCRFLNVTTVIATRPASFGAGYSYLLNCNVREAFVREGSAGVGGTDNFVDGGLVTNQIAVDHGAGCFVDFHCLGQAGPFGAYNGSFLIIGSAGSMDAPAFGGFVVQDAHIRSQNSFYGYGGAMWGTTAVLNVTGVDILDGGKMRYEDATKLTVTGSNGGGDFKLAGFTTGFPCNPTTGNYDNSINTTWANLANSASSHDSMHRHGQFAGIAKNVAGIP